MISLLYMKYRPPVPGAIHCAGSRFPLAKPLPRFQLDLGPPPAACHLPPANPAHTEYTKSWRCKVWR